MTSLDESPNWDRDGLQDLGAQLDAYRRATDTTDTAGLRRRLTQVGFFGPGASVVQHRRVPLALRVAGVAALFLGLAGLSWGLASGQARVPELPPSAPAVRVARVEGKVLLSRTGSRHWLHRGSRIRVGDTLRGARGLSNVSFPSGGSLTLMAGSNVRCIRSVGRIRAPLAFDVSGGGVSITAKTTPIVFRAADQWFSCRGTRCSVSKCCPWKITGALEIRPEGLGLQRFRTNTGCVTCPGRTKIQVGTCRGCGIGK